MNRRILIAGIGNIFCGDDAFGVEMARRLAACPLPDGVRVVDFGIRGCDLAFALMDGYDAVILVDAVSRGEPPGTVYLIEPESGPGAPTPPMTDPHALDPATVLQMAKAFSPSSAKVLLVGCEPAVLENEAGDFELSPPVAGAIPKAVEMVRALVRDFTSGTTWRAALQPAKEEGFPRHNDSIQTD